MTPVTWSDEIDGILHGDATAGLAYVTPAGGTVVGAVAPVGLRDRERGTVTFTTSYGFARKLDRIRRDPRVALAYHAREHGFSDSPRFVLVQGQATIKERDERWLREVLSPAAERFMGPPKEGPFWDRWLREYYELRVAVEVAVQRIVSWPDLRCGGRAEVIGAPRPESPPAPQAEPKRGIAPRIPAERAAKRLAALPHRLVGVRDADGYPLVLPYDVGAVERQGLELRPTGEPLPPGGRRAGVLAHAYRAKVVGLNTKQYTGWLAVEDGRALYAPHTESGFRAPANKTLLLLANGFMAKRGMRELGRAKAHG